MAAVANAEAAAAVANRDSSFWVFIKSPGDVGEPLASAQAWQRARRVQSLSQIRRWRKRVPFTGRKYAERAGAVVACARNRQHIQKRMTPVPLKPDKFTKQLTTDQMALTGSFTPHKASGVNAGAIRRQRVRLFRHADTGAGLGLDP